MIHSQIVPIAMQIASHHVTRPAGRRQVTTLSGEGLCESKAPNGGIISRKIGHNTGRSGPTKSVGGNQIQRPVFTKVSPPAQRPDGNLLQVTFTGQILLTFSIGLIEKPLCSYITPRKKRQLEGKWFWEKLERFAENCTFLSKIDLVTHCYHCHGRSNPHCYPH